MFTDTTIAYLLLGTNLGNREGFLEQAIHSIDNIKNKIVALSSVYETEAWGTEGQPAYLNQVIALQTSLSPIELLEWISDIEKSIGRTRRERWESRIIDIDILYYGSQVVQLKELEIPHPRLHLRNFTLYPLAEIAPEYLHPVLRKTNRELLEESQDTLSVARKYGIPEK